MKKKNSGKDNPLVGGAGTTPKHKALPWLLGLLVVLVAGLAVIAQLLLVAAPRDNQQQRVASLAKQQAAWLDFSLSKVRQQAELLAKDAAVNAALVAGQAEANALSAKLSRLLAPSQVVLASSVARGELAQPLSYVARSNLTKLRAGDQSSIQVLTRGKDSRILLFYRSANRAGIVVLQHPLAPLWQNLKKQLPGGAGISVTQGSLTLLQAGATQGAFQAEVTTQAGLGVRVYLPAAGSLLEQPLFLVVSLVMVALALLILWLYASALSGLLKQDAERLARQIGRLADGLKPDKELPRLDVLQALLFLPKMAGLATAKKSDSGKPKMRKKADAFTDIIVEEDSSMLVAEDRQQAATASVALPQEIFRAYDIRGQVGKTLTLEGVELIGRAIGSEAQEVGQQTVIVARDGRLSGPDMSAALIRGLRASGRDVIDIGDVPTPVLYYATKVLDSQTGVCITGSHNPKDYNGLKMVLNGDALYGEQIQALRQRIAQGSFTQGAGQLEQRDISGRYLSDILDDIVLAKQMKVVIDSGNGIAGKLAPSLFRDLGCEVTELYCEVDGNFPNHHPDPGKPENLKDLIAAVKSQQADIGLAFDGDGDRVGVVTASGKIIYPDRLLMLFARDLLSRSPGVDIIFDVKCSRSLPTLIRKQGGIPLMWKTGHSFIKAKLKETGAPLAGEMSGHIFFADRWYGVDDGLYAAARLLEILSLEALDSDQVFAELKTGVVTPELSIKTTEAAKFGLMDKLVAAADQFVGGNATTLDGLRVDYPDGWGLVRASNTTPLLIARFEGKDEAAIERIQQLFHKHLQAIDPSLDLPF